MDLGKSKSVACRYEAMTGEHRFETVQTCPQAFQDLLASVRPDRVVIEICPAAGRVGDLVRALAGGADDVTVHYLLATTYMNLGQRLRAVHHCREILKIDPDHEWAHHFLYGKEYKKFPKKRRYALRQPIEGESGFSLMR